MKNISSVFMVAIIMVVTIMMSCVSETNGEDPSIPNIENQELTNPEVVQVNFNKPGIWTTYNINGCKWHSVKLVAKKTQIHLHFKDVNIDTGSIKLGPMSPCENIAQPISFIRTYRNGSIYESAKGFSLENISLSLEDSHDLRGFMRLSSPVNLSNISEALSNTEQSSFEMVLDLNIAVGLERNCISDSDKIVPTRNVSGYPDCM